MTTKQNHSRSGEYSGTLAPTSKLPPVDEVCRILARVLNRVQTSVPPTAPTGDAS